MGDITLGTNHEFVDPRLGPIELLYTFTQTGPATGGGGNPFIDNVFYVASDNDPIRPLERDRDLEQPDQLGRDLAGVHRRRAH
jgi:hypothetical protein